MQKVFWTVISPEWMADIPSDQTFGRLHLGRGVMLMVNTFNIIFQCIVFQMLCSLQLQRKVGL